MQIASVTVVTGNTEFLICTDCGGMLFDPRLHEDFHSRLGEIGLAEPSMPPDFVPPEMMEELHAQTNGHGHVREGTQMELIHPADEDNAESDQEEGD